MPDDRNKQEVEDLMVKTFQERRALAADPRCPVHLLLEAFPKLADFQGKMVRNTQKYSIRLIARNAQLIDK